MSWTSAKPLDSWGADSREMFAYHREMYTRTKFDSFTWNPPSVGATTTVDTTLTTADADVLDGLRVGMAVHVTPPSDIDAGIVLGGAWVATDNTLTIRLGNVTAAPINPGSGTWALHGKVI